MRCEDARALLLEADLPDLDADGPSPLADHLRTCARCAEAAAAILQELASLESQLTASVPDGAVDTIMARLGPAGASKPPQPEAAPLSLSRWRRSPWIPVAMAAGVAGLFFVARMRTPIPERMLPVAASAPSLPLVESSGAATVAVIETDNPDITVLWFF